MVKKSIGGRMTAAKSRASKSHHGDIGTSRKGPVKIY